MLREELQRSRDETSRLHEELGSRKATLQSELDQRDAAHQSGDAYAVNVLRLRARARVRALPRTDVVHNDACVRTLKHTHTHATHTHIHTHTILNTHTHTHTHTLHRNAYAHNAAGVEEVARLERAVLGGGKRGEAGGGRARREQDVHTSLSDSAGALKQTEIAEQQATIAELKQQARNFQELSSDSSACLTLVGGLAG